MTKNRNNKFYQLRYRRKQTQEYMAEKLGVGQSCYSKLESGQLKPSFDTLVKLRTKFRVDINKYLESYK